MLTKHASREQLSNKADKIFNPTNRISRSIYELSNIYELSSKDISFLLDGLAQSILQKKIFRPFERTFYQISVCNFDVF